jgi:D-inositol-3-phosphate glycosyltransferase
LNQGIPRVKPRLLVVGQAVHPTGYARVLQSILQHLHFRFEILHFGVNYREEPIAGDYSIRPNTLRGDVLGREQLPGLLEQFGPDLIFLCHDPFFYEVHEAALLEYQRQKPTARTVFYCPIEWEETMPGLLRTLSSVNELVLYTEFGRRVVQSAFDAAESCRAPSMSVLPHGLDTALFYPLVRGNFEESRRRARQQLFPHQPQLQNAFIVLNANRNCPRKRIDLTLRAFAEFARDKGDDVYLYLHMGMRDSGCDILPLAEELGLANRLLMTTTSLEKPEVEDAYMNLIYNACDVGINTATGEGWGLVAFEHAATGAAQIVPDHSACRELWAEKGLLIPVEEVPGIVSVQDTAACIERLYSDCALRKQLAQESYAYATRPEFHWGQIAQQWEKLFQKVMADHAKGSA